MPKNEQMCSQINNNEQKGGIYINNESNGPKQVGE